MPENLDLTPSPFQTTMTQPTILTAGKLQIAFERIGDRFTHRIGLTSPDGPQWILTSVEGGPANLWPTSPPLQELHVEERSGGIQVALLVGMAGGNHWSASCQVDPGTGELQLDVACRIKNEPERLGSIYQLASGATLGQEQGQSVVKTPAGTLRVECQNQTTLKNPAESQLAFLAQLPESVPETVQWRYRFWF